MNALDVSHGCGVLCTRVAVFVFACPRVAVLQTEHEDKIRAAAAQLQTQLHRVQFAAHRLAMIKGAVFIRSHSHTCILCFVFEASFFVLDSFHDVVF